MWASKQWHTYQDALKRSEPLWVESDKELIERPLPEVNLSGNLWHDWEPRIEK